MNKLVFIFKENYKISHSSFYLETKLKIQCIQYRFFVVVEN
jgi:hypothetical protein